MVMTMIDRWCSMPGRWALKVGKEGRDVLEGTVCEQGIC